MNPVKTHCLIILFAASVHHVLAAVDFAQCFAEIRNGSHGSMGGTDTHGNPVDIKNATAITYDLCLQAWGGAFSWSSFSQQFSAWLLPWLALLSQFPFGCKYKWDNLMSVILALGSPCLAAYSLALTVLNTKWVARRFANTNYPNSRHAVIILCCLQQTALKVTTEGGQLASLIVLSENDPWWEELAQWLDYADIHTWTIAGKSSDVTTTTVTECFPGVTSIAWVVIAYALTIIDAFSTISTDPNSNGQGLSGVGSIWLWMIPLTIGYLQISPRCDAERVTTALCRANQVSHVAGPNGAMNADAIGEMRALSIHHLRDSLYHDQEATAPIYNYARFLSYVQVVEEFVSAFRYATEKANRRIPVNSAVTWEVGDGKSIHPANRQGSAAQIEEYCSAPLFVRRSHWGPDVCSRLFVASLAALALQWSTSGASLLIVYFTPTVGLGCRSFAYLLYAVLATVVWATLVVSSILSHYATVFPEPSGPEFAHRFAARLAVFLRRLAKVLATLNAAWILGAFLLQFANFFDRCYCNSVVLGLGKRAHNDMFLGSSDISAMKGAWVGGIVLAVFVSSFWLAFINVFMDPPLPPAERR
ncbi:hypothetical protein GGX14DRAFT_621400 [Mycena pura]|uniref:Uncharacterized protein n=1 Tax=Mycena pura TaxID=153505 RepID=A0AAD6YCP5_9AGAR|nr:hypothetical protein GGX14DRAFT_621400 [Mycena pura]